jgi:hypothetical protein
MAADPYTVNKGASEEDIQARIVGPSKVYTVVPTMRSGDARRQADSGGLLPAARALLHQVCSRPCHHGWPRDQAMAELRIRSRWLIRRIR